jgi:phosphohistidine swiveling domain-containing protein
LLLFAQKVSNNINGDNKYFEKVKVGFYNTFDELLKYYQGKYKINNGKDLKKFYQLWFQWWSPMAIIMVAADLSSIPENIKSDAMEIRSKTQKYTDAGDRIFVDYLIKRFPKLYKFTNVLTPEEVFDFPESISQNTLNLIAKRLNGCALINGKLVLKKDILRELRKQKLALEKIAINKDTPIIYGTSASNGFVKGKTRVVIEKDEYSKLKKGEILVTHMTSTDRIFEIKKALGIVTDEGGLSSHASIISRELNKPCIVGTKVATKILKTGDLIEVNANLGQIKILKRI